MGRLRSLLSRELLSARHPSMKWPLQLDSCSGLGAPSWIGKPRMLAHADAVEPTDFIERGEAVLILCFLTRSLNHAIADEADVSA